MIIVEIPDVQLYSTETDENFVMDDSVAGVVSQFLASTVVQALRNGVGFSIRKDSLEIKVTTRRSVQTDVTETYVG